MVQATGFKAARSAVITALLTGAFQHEARGDINIKNALAMGAVTAQFVADLIKKANGLQHSCSPHHQGQGIDVHVVQTGGWYVKFYFLEPDCWFISVHRQDRYEDLQTG